MYPDVPLFTYTYETLPEKIYPVSAVIRGGYWLVLYFLQYVFNRLPVGDALLNAKIDYAKRQIRRQGFLDEDDQKTLLEFVLYGDPSFRLPDPRR